MLNLLMNFDDAFKLTLGSSKNTNNSILNDANMHVHISRSILGENIKLL